LSEKCYLEILSPSGQIVFSGYYSSLERNSLSLDLKDLPSGYYILRLRNGETTGSGRIIKVK